MSPTQCLTICTVGNHSLPPQSCTGRAVPHLLCPWILGSEISGPVLSRLWSGLTHAMQSVTQSSYKSPLISVIGCRRAGGCSATWWAHLVTVWHKMRMERYPHTPSLSLPRSLCPQNIVLGMESVTFQIQSAPYLSTKKGSMKWQERGVACGTLGNTAELSTHRSVIQTMNYFLLNWHWLFCFVCSILFVGHIGSALSLILSLWSGITSGSTEGNIWVQRSNLGYLPTRQVPSLLYLVPWTDFVHI